MQRLYYKAYIRLKLVIICFCLQPHAYQGVHHELPILLYDSIKQVYAPVFELLIKIAHYPKIHKCNGIILLYDYVARVRICMEYPMHEHLRHYSFKAVLDYLVEVYFFLFYLAYVVQLNPVYELQSQYPASCIVIINFWDVYCFAALEVLIKPFCISRLKPEIKLLFCPLLELAYNLCRFVPFYRVKIILKQFCEILHYLNISFHHVADIGPLDLDCHLFPCFQGRPVHLAYRCRCNRVSAKIQEDMLYWPAKFFSYYLPDFSKRERLHPVLELF